MKKINVAALTGIILVTVMGLLGSFAPSDFGGTFLLPAVLVASSALAGFLLKYSFKIKNGLWIVAFGVICATGCSYAITLFQLSPALLFIVFGVLWAAVFTGMYWIFELWETSWSNKIVLVVLSLVVSGLICLVAREISVQQYRKEYLRSIQPS